MPDLDVSYTVVEGRYFLPSGVERPCWIATLSDGSQIVWDAETGEHILDYDWAYALT